MTSLSTRARRALYERTLETLRTSCMHAPGREVSDDCPQQADFIKRFPECDCEWGSLAARFVHGPSR